MTEDYRIQVYGHEWAQQLLRLARQQNATRHAYLFLGPEHIGKTTLARSFAQALTCENPEGETGLGACGRCRSCRLAAEGMHPDHRFFAPAGNQLVIEQIREVVREASRSPIESRFKVFIITSFERANLNAANALLKTLEEPSATTRIILVSHQPSGLLDTIISRCQLLRLRPLPEKVIIAALREKSGLSEQDALRLARLSNGRLGTALALADDPEAWQTYKERIAQMLTIVDASTAERMAAAQTLEKSGHLETTLQEWLLWWRDVLIIQNNNTSLVINQEHLPELTHLAERIPKAQVRRFIEAIMATSGYLRKNVNRQLALEALLLKAPVGG
jgi:DNA polymerase-3 subunit delta'